MANEYSVSVRIQGQNQLSTPVGQAQRSLQGLNTEARNTNTTLSGLQRGFQGLQTVMGAAFVGVTIAGAAHFTEQMYSLGVETQRSEKLFNSFNAQVGNTNALLDRLRQTTRGTVTDLDLMNASSSMLSMGIARNADEVERLVDIGVTFAQARGEDVSASLENLSMLLSNQSYLRLDTLGISSAEVRELAEGYRRAGMDSSEAFTAAFLEVAEGMAPQMAAVAEASITPFQRMRVEIENFTSDLADNFAFLVNHIIGELGRLGGGGGGASGQSVLNAQSAAGVYAQLFAGSGMSAGNLSGQNISGALTAAILAQQAGMDTGSAGFMDLLTQNAFGLGSNDILFQGEQGQAMLQQAAGVVGWFNQYVDVVADAQQTAAIAARVTGSGVTARPGFAAGDFGSAGMGGLFAPFMLDVERQAQQLQTLLGGAGMAGGLRIIAPESARDAENTAYAIETLVNRLEGAGLEESFLAPLRQAAEASRAGADAAAEWADNLEKASLAQLFGQTSGGRLGEIDAAVLAALEAGGADAGTLDALRTAMGLDSGQITQMSQQFDSEVVPFLEDVASQMGTDAYTRMRRAYDDALAGAALTGQPTIDMASLMGGFAYYGGAGGAGGQQFSVNPGDTPGAIAARLGVGVDQVLAATGARNAYSMPTGTFNLPGGGAGGLMDMNFDLLEGQMMALNRPLDQAEASAETITDEMTTAVETLAEGIAGVFGRTYQLPIELVISGGGGLLGQMIAAAVAGNGGTTPGAVATTGRSAGAGVQRGGLVIPP